ncbi:MAG: ABC transporter permease [Anaerolineae bacterium]
MSTRESQSDRIAQIAPPSKVVQRSLWQNMWRSLRRNPLAITGFALLFLVITSAVFAPWIAPHDPLAIKLEDKLLPPGGQYLLGTDDMGRDLLSRCIYGFRISLRAAAIVLVLACMIGICLGGTAGYLGGRIDNLLMRMTDMFLAFPGYILALAIAGALGPSMTNAIISVAVVWWPWYARLARGQVLAVRQNLYIDAARSIGAGHIRILVRHILPNCITPLLVMATMDLGIVILVLANLSFLGLGAQPPEPELGYMIARGRLYFMNQWWVATVPGAAIFTMALGTNLVGDAWRDILDPRTQSR